MSTPSKAETIAINALRRVEALDFDKTDDGRNNLYSGPKRFVQAWLIAHSALKRITRAQGKAAS